jgi:hypothetical protein
MQLFNTKSQAGMRQGITHLFCNDRHQIRKDKVKVAAERNNGESSKV